MTCGCCGASLQRTQRRVELTTSAGASSKTSCTLHCLQHTQPLPLTTTIGVTRFESFPALAHVKTDRDPVDSLFDAFDTDNSSNAACTALRLSLAAHH